MDYLNMTDPQVSVDEEIGSSANAGLVRDLLNAFMRPRRALADLDRASLVGRLEEIDERLKVLEAEAETLREQVEGQQVRVQERRHRFERAATLSRAIRTLRAYNKAFAVLNKLSDRELMVSSMIVNAYEFLETYSVELEIHDELCPPTLDEKGANS
jgi:predicted  nucleic acid-binding Zn-ribbon protein